MPQVQRVRYWCFTDWPPEDSFAFTRGDPDPEKSEGLPKFIEADMNYMIYGLETCPTTHKDHFQGYVQFKKAMTMTAIKSKNYFSNKVHLEVSKGTPEQAAEYCKKEGNYIEDGVLQAKGKRNDLMAAKEMIDEGASIVAVANECFNATAKYYKFFEYYRQLKLPTDRTVFDKSYCTILWGDPGSGKSRTAYACDSYQVLQYNPRSGFWSAAWDGSHRIIIDDVCPATFQPRELWLNILDPFAKQLSINIKGGYSKFAPTELVLTSNFDPTTWMPDDAAFKRRLDEFCTIRHMVGFVDVAMRRFFVPKPTGEDGVVDLTTSNESEPSSPVSWADSSSGESDDDGASEYSQQVRFRACDRANASAGEYVGPVERHGKRCRYAEEACEDSIDSEEERFLLSASKDY